MLKWSNSGKGVAPSPIPRCSSKWKGSLLVVLDYGRQLYLLITVCIKSFPFWPVAQPKLKDPVWTQGRIVAFMPFLRVLALCEMQTTSWRIWTHYTGSISHNDNRYVMSISGGYFLKYLLKWRCKTVKYSFNISSKHILNRYSVRPFDWQPKTMINFMTLSTKSVSRLNKLGMFFWIFTFVENLYL